MLVHCFLLQITVTISHSSRRLHRLGNSKECEQFHDQHLWYSLEAKDGIMNFWDCRSASTFANEKTAIAEKTIGIRIFPVCTFERSLSMHLKDSTQNTLSHVFLVLQRDSFNGCDTHSRVARLCCELGVFRRNAPLLEILPRFIGETNETMNRHDFGAR